MAFCSGVLALGVAGVIRSLDKRAATAAGVAPEPQTVTTRLLGLVVPVPNAGRPLKVVVDGEGAKGSRTSYGGLLFRSKAVTEIPSA